MSANSTQGFRQMFPSIAEAMDNAYDAGMAAGRANQPYNPPTTRLETTEYSRGFKDGRLTWTQNQGM